MDFNSMPAEVRARLLAQHLQYHLKLVDDLSDDLKIMAHRMENRKLEKKTLLATIKEQEQQIERYQKFIRDNGLQKAFIGRFVNENKAA